MSEERRKTTPVQDRAAEWGINVGNILSSLILLAIVWVGNTILSLKDEIRLLASNQTINISKIADHERRLQESEATNKEQDKRLYILEKNR